MTVTNGTTYGDNAGVGNAAGTGSFPIWLAIQSRAFRLPSQVSSRKLVEVFYNPAAFGVPTGLTFGGPGRKSSAIHRG